MKVEDVMTRNVKSCRPETNLSQVTALMRDYDFGAMPVVDDENRVRGMITDRDIAIAAATKGRLATEINVGEVISSNVYACAFDENVNSALKTMRRERVRRLQVIGGAGKLAGVLSINDIVRVLAVVKIIATTINLALIQNSRSLNNERTTQEIK